MIETVHQAPGRFDLQFDDPPESIKELTARAYAALIVTPAPITHPERIAYSSLLSLASYVGIVRGRGDDRTSITGYGPAILLTLARQTVSATVTARPLYDGSNTSWIRNNVLRIGSSENNGLTVGTITSAASPTKTGKTVAGQTPLEVLDAVARMFSVEWRVNPAGTLKLQKFVSNVEGRHHGQTLAGRVGLVGQITHFFVEIADRGKQPVPLFGLAGDAVFTPQKLDVELFHIRPPGCGRAVLRGDCPPARVCH